MWYKTIEILFILFGLIAIIGHANDTETDPCPKIITRRRWGARGAKNISYQIFPVKYAIIHHTVTPQCDTKVKCSNSLLGIQNFHVNQRGYDDIAYNFLVSDNDVYEGVGWHVQGAHTYTYNANSTGIAFIGTFTEELPTQTAINLAKKLLECGVKLGELDPNYILLGARQLVATESPGLELYSAIQDWDHWSPKP